MRPEIQVKSTEAPRRVPGRGWTVTESVSGVDIDPKVFERLGSVFANAIINAGYGETLTRRFFRQIKQNETFKLMEDVFHESQTSNQI